MELSSGDRVLVTGAGGFIGSAVTRALIARGVQVVALLEPGADHANLAELDLERLEVDLRDGEGVDRAVKECRAVFHVAALYRFWARDRRQFYDVNVGGTRNIMDAAKRAGTERLVYTSTVGTLGLESGKHSRPSDERSFADVSHLFGSYKQSKYVAEHEVLRAAAEGLPVSIILPTFPLGPGDRAPTPTGQLILDYLNGRVPGYVDTILNVAHVDDLALGQILALERGAVGRSYILGGENYTLKRLLDTLATVTGLPLGTVKSHLYRAHRQTPRSPCPRPRGGAPVGVPRGKPPAPPSLGPHRSGPDVHHPDELRRLPGAHRARPCTAAGSRSPRRLGPLVRGPGQGHPGPAGQDHQARLPGARYG